MYPQAARLSYTLKSVGNLASCGVASVVNGMKVLVNGGINISELDG
jgi:hypothetical protein